MNLTDLPLGKATDYPQSYSPELLAPIPRADNRRQLGLSAEAALPFAGRDVWNMYELSWLDSRGKPQVAMLRLSIPCTSPNLVESKSLKLYFNSFNQERIDSQERLGDMIQRDLAKVVGGDLQRSFETLNQDIRPLSAPAGECIDTQDIEVTDYHPQPAALAVTTGPVVSETLYCQLFRSNCPITNQPDWATVSVRYEGMAIDRAGLLRYLVSYRQHNDFHENCVERTFLDIYQHCRPQRLCVSANFTRRGGIDINPVRYTEGFAEERDFPRHARQ